MSSSHATFSSYDRNHSSHSSHTNHTNPNARVKRKPPPAFPYSSRYPHPDPTDPFAPLAVLRDRAHSSNGALVSPQEDGSYAPTPAVSPRVGGPSHGRHFTPETLSPDTIYHPRTVVEQHPKPNRPWLGLAGGYNVESSKPSRPPKSKTRPERAETPQQTLVISRPPLAESTPRRERHLQQPPPPPPSQERDSAYHYRRRSQSALAMIQNQQGSTSKPVPPSGPPRADPSRQYTYDDRQSHGHLFNDLILDVDDFEQELTGILRHSDSPRGSSPSIQSRHPTPPMTPDDSLSTTSVSPREPSIPGTAGSGSVPARVRGRSGSQSPPLIGDVPPKALRRGKGKNVATRTEQSTVQQQPSHVVAPAPKDTPASIHSADFPILLPPVADSAPPSPLHAPASLNNHHTSNMPHATMRHAESEPESMPMDGTRRKTSSFSSIRRRLGGKNSLNVPVGVRGMRISNPSPITGRKPSFGSESSISVAHGGYEALLGPPNSNTALQQITNIAAQTSSLTVARAEPVDVPRPGPTLPSFPKPKKSLSHVNLALKPLPNLSMAPSFAPSANPSMASAIVPSLPAEERVMEFQSRLPPTSSPIDFRPDPRRFLGPYRSYRQPNSIPKHAILLRPPEPEYESEVEDESAYTALLAIRELLTPEPVLRSLEQPRAIAQVYSPPLEPTPEPFSALLPPPAVLPSPPVPSPPPPSPPRPSKRLVPIKRRTESPIRDLRPTSPQHPRSESPAVAARSKSPIPPRAESAPPAVIDISPPIPYRGPGPLPLTPPPRSKSPAQFQAKVQPSIQAVVRARSPTPPRPRPNSQHESNGRSKRVVQEVSESEVEATAPDYLPVAQLRKQGPTLSRQTTNTTQSSARRPSGQATRDSPSNSLPSKRQENTREIGAVVIEDEDEDYPISELRKQNQRQATVTTQSSNSRRPSVQSAGSSRDSPSRMRTRREEQQPKEEVLVEVEVPPEPPVNSQRRKPTQPWAVDRQNASTPTRRPPPTQTTSRDTPSRQRVNREETADEEESETDVESRYAPPPPKTRRQPPPVSRQANATTQTPNRLPSAQAQSVISQRSARARGQSPIPPPPPPAAARAKSPELLRSPPVTRPVPETPEPAPQLLSPAVRRQRTDPPTPAFSTASPPLTSRSPPTFQASGSRSLDFGPRTPGSFGSSRKGYSYPPIPFDEHTPVTKEQLSRAAAITVVAQNGIRVPFGELFREKKTIVCVIRHFWCPADQDYMHHICKSTDVEALKRAGVELVIIGNGSPGMIKSYKHIFRSPFHIFTDPTNQLHAALGMTLRSNDPGPDSEKAEYIRHGLVGGIAMVVRNALRVGMPVWEKGGDAHQLGGEFIFGPGLTCSFTHRMVSTRSHTPIPHVVAAAGVQPYRMGSDETSRTPTQEDDETWAKPRLQKNLSRTNAKREKRRAASEDHWHHAPAADDSMQVEVEPSDSDNASLYDNWGLTSTMKKYTAAETDREEAERTRPRSRRSHRKQTRTFHVSNPDQSFSPRSSTRGRVQRDAWRDGEASGSGRYGRSKEESYMLTHDAVAYSFGKQ